MSEPRFAGVDGGGTKTAIVVVDTDGNEITRETTTTSNSAVIGHERAAETLRQLIQSAASSAGADLPFQAIWCGLSGSDRPEDHRQLRPRLEDLAIDLQMTNDAELAIGGLPDRIGIAIVSGTGSIAFGRNASRTRARAGGWGHVFGDQGSGYDVARQALSAFSAFTDGYGPGTSLVERLTEYWELSDPYTIINRVYDPRTTKGDIARLSQIVVDEAARGDEVAQGILERAAVDLAMFARAAARRLELGPVLDLALVGGMLVHVELFRTLVIADLAQDWEIGHVELVEDPALTAARSLAAAWKGTVA